MAADSRNALYRGHAIVMEAEGEEYKKLIESRFNHLENPPSLENLAREKIKHEKQTNVEPLVAKSDSKKDFEENSTGAQKETTGKLRMDLIPPEVVASYASVLTDGARKYSDRNWEKGLKLQEHHLSAALRHINKWQHGVDINVEQFTDKDGNVVEVAHNHMEHALWHIAAIVTQLARGRDDLDDRVKL